MPTAIIVDVSLSMARCVEFGESRSGVRQTRLQYVKEALLRFFEHMSVNLPFETSALFTYSSTCRCVVEFTHDYSQLLYHVDKLAFEDKTNLEDVFKVVKQVCQHYQS
jgi:hypothetical protein